MDEIIRLKSWIREYGKHKEPAFIQDLESVIAIAEEAIEITKQRSALQQLLEDVLLGDEFLKRFAHAFANTPLSGIETLPPTSAR